MSRLWPLAGVVFLVCNFCPQIQGQDGGSNDGGFRKLFFVGTSATGPNFIANATSGPPFQVSSSALVSNLNSALLNGLPSTAFARTGASNTFTGHQTINGDLTVTGNIDPVNLTVTNNITLGGSINGGFRVDPDGGCPNAIGGLLTTNNVLAGVQCAAIAGGTSNTASSSRAAIGGGDGNTAGAGYAATVCGGANNNAGGAFATVCGGHLNSASGVGATILAGEENSASGSYSAVVGGFGNSAVTNGFAAGIHAKSIHSGAFVWADGNFIDFRSTAANEFSVRATGGARFISAIDGSGNPTAGVVLPAGGGAWSSLSDRNSKEHLAPVDGEALLVHLAALPVQAWNYRSQAPTVRHIGPTAQDFRAAFGLGDDDKYISTIDAEGVALAAVKELYRISVAREDEVRKLAAEVQELKARLAQMPR